jgi:hypothetical protein
MEEMVEYRGYVIFWRRFCNDGPWLARIAAASPSLFPATAQLAATEVHGLNRNDMLVNAKIYIDRLLCPNKDVERAAIAMETVRVG